jgi:hypothetical protein
LGNARGLRRVVRALNSGPAVLYTQNGAAKTARQVDRARPRSCGNIQHALAGSQVEEISEMPGQRRSTRVE